MVIDEWDEAGSEDHMSARVDDVEAPELEDNADPDVETLIDEITSTVAKLSSTRADILRYPREQTPTDCRDCMAGSS